MLIVYGLACPKESRPLLVIQLQFDAHRIFLLDISVDFPFVRILRGKIKIGAFDIRIHSGSLSARFPRRPKVPSIRTPSPR